MTPTERFLALVCRELGADDARLADPADPVSENEVRCPVADGRVVVAHFENVPDDAAALERRLEILAQTFAEALGERPSAPPRAPITTSLLDELTALTRRAAALNALVIDGHSPVVWGASDTGGLEMAHVLSDQLVMTPQLVQAIELLQMSRKDLIASIGRQLTENAENDENPETDSDDGDDLETESTKEPIDWEESVREPPRLEAVPSLPTPPPPVLTEVPLDATAIASRRAIEAVRKLGTFSSLKRGRPLRHTEADSDFGYVAHSFASIYVLVLVYQADFDRLRAERALIEALPRIERLVLALPPLDPRPSPVAGVMSMRRSRKR